MDNAEQFSKFLRPIREFTLEIEKNRSLLFLDVFIEKSVSKLLASVYRNPTNTGQFLNYDSNRSTSVKLALVAFVY